jgi:hypothetical protein
MAVLQGLRLQPTRVADQLTSNLVPRIRMVGAIPHLPPYALTTWYVIKHTDAAKFIKKGVCVFLLLISPIDQKQKPSLI